MHDCKLWRFWWFYKGFWRILLAWRGISASWSHKQNLYGISDRIRWFDFDYPRLKGMERFFTVTQNVPFVLECNDSTSRLSNMKFRILTQRFIDSKCFYISILLCHMYPINVIVWPRAYRLDSNFITKRFLKFELRKFDYIIGFVIKNKSRTRRKCGRMTVGFSEK